MGGKNSNVLRPVDINHNKSFYPGKPVNNAMTGLNCVTIGHGKQASN